MASAIHASTLSRSIRTFRPMRRRRQSSSDAVSQSDETGSQTNVCGFVGAFAATGRPRDPIEFRRPAAVASGTIQIADHGRVFGAPLAVWTAAQKLGRLR
jgi:hypothetical protein